MCLKLLRHVSIAVRYDSIEMFHLEVLAERLPLTHIFQNMTFIAYVQRLVNVTKTAKFNLPSIHAAYVAFLWHTYVYLTL